MRQSCNDCDGVRKKQDVPKKRERRKQRWINRGMGKRTFTLRWPHREIKPPQPAIEPRECGLIFFIVAFFPTWFLSRMRFLAFRDCETGRNSFFSWMWLSGVLSKHLADIQPSSYFNLGANFSLKSRKLWQKKKPVGEATVATAKKTTRKCTNC